MRRNAAIIEVLHCLANTATSILLIALSAASTSHATQVMKHEGLIASSESGWPQWRGVRRDGISEEEGLLGAWPEGGPKLLWKVGELGKGWSSPIVVRGRVYITGDVGNDLVIYCFSTEGSPVWKVTNGKAWKGPYPGARSTCTYSEGRIYIMNAHGRLACLDPADGDEVWAVDVLERFGARNITWALSECLLVDGPRVIVTPGGGKALMAALDKRDGSTVWTTEPIAGDDRTSHSSPILFTYGGRRLIASCSSAHGFGVDADTGELLWTVPLRNQHKVNTSTPIYGSGQVYYVTSSSPEQGRSYRLVPEGDGISTEHMWMSILDTQTGSGVLVDGTLYAAGYRKCKWWFAVDWKTGETKDELKELTTGAAIYTDERLYALDERGAAALLKPTEDGLEIAGRFQLVKGRVKDAWAHPVLLDGRLYLRYHDDLWCYDVKER